MDSPPYCAVLYISVLYRRGEEGEKLVAVAGELGRSDSGNSGEVGPRARTTGSDLLERRVVEDDVGRPPGPLRAREPPRLQRGERGRKLLLRAALLAPREAELGQEAARLAR